MIRKIKNQDGSGFNDSRIISTRDIFLGTNVTSSLEEYLKNQEDELNQLKKWTKWYVKYGGMGSGGGGTGSSKPDCNIYLKKGTTYSTPVNNGATVILQGKGNYTLTFTIIRGSGHTFHIKWKFGNGREQEKYINESSSTISVTQPLDSRTTFTYSVTDDTMGEDVISGEATIIPEQFTISTNVFYKNGRVTLNNGDPVSLGTVKSGFIANYRATISYPVDVYYQVRYQLEGQDWIYVGEEGIFERPETLEDSAKPSTHDVIIDFPQDIRDEDYVGKKITFELLYGTTSGSLNSNNNNTYYITITPTNGYYVLISEPDDYKNTLVSDPTDDNLEEINRGSIPFYIMLCADRSNVSQTLYIGLYRHKDGVDTWGEDTWESILLDDSQPPNPIFIHSNIRTNIKYSIAKQFDVGTSTPGIYKIIGKQSESIQTIKYFKVKQTSSEWDYTRFDEKMSLADITCHHTYYSSNTAPLFSKPLELFKKSSEVNISSSIGFDAKDKEFSSIFNLGLQYSNSNDDNVPFLKFDVGDSSNPEYLYVYQNKIYYQDTTDLINQFYFPKVDLSNSEENTWHLFTLAINLIKVDTAGTRFFEITVFIDGVLEGFYYSGNTTLNDSVPLNILKVTLNPNNSHVLKINLFDFNFCNRTGKTVLSFTNEDSDFKGKYSYVLDNYISSYFNKYLSELDKDDQIKDSIEFSENIFNFSFDEYGMPYTSIGVLNNLISCKDSNNNKVLNIPVLVLNPNESSFSNQIKYDSFDNLIDKPFFPNWFLAKWPESPTNDNGKPGSVTGKIFYIPEDVTSSVENNEVKNESFTFSIQGSSTRAYGIKNIELSIMQGEDSGSSSSSVKLFTPNFDETNEMSLLPEQSFTLKADLVDSSACNNNAIGDFVNKNTTPLDASHVPARNSDCSGHIKNCLTGFPILVFLNISPAEENSDPYYKRYYYLGIYNFNLGRNSFVNLGYYQNSSTYDEIWDKLVNSPKGFKIIDVDEDKLTLDPNLVVTEISNGNPHFDFSQFDESVLFSGQENDDFSMFSADDTVEGSPTIAKSVLGSAVRQISLAGGYLFGKLKKNFIKLGFADSTADIKLPYLLNKNGISLNCVSDYRTQYTRVAGSSNYIEIAELINEANKNDLINCIGTDPETGIPPYVDLRSLVEYYVICMCFGMVDSVLKNMEIKTWSPRRDNLGNTIPATIYLAFYDMDTALGIDNSGKSVSYFAFSDYWETNNLQSSNNVINASVATIYPDFFYDKGESGYDIPSSYLFSIAKYSFLEILELSDDELNTFPKLTIGNNSYYFTPVNLYSYFRDEQGELSNAEYFMNNYFNNRLKKIPNSLKNLNYRSKYAKICYWNIDSYNNKIREIAPGGIISMVSASSLDDLAKFKGSGNERKKDWLESRLHLLDAYFNVNSDIFYPINYPTFYSDEDGTNLIELGRETNNISNFINNIIKKINWNNSVKVRAANGTYRSAYYSNNTSLTVFSDDVSLVKEMFEGEHKASMNTTLSIKSPSYTPIVYSISGESPKAYLVGDNTGTIQYNIGMYSTGNIEWHLYGSQEFTYVNNLGGLNFTEGITLVSNKIQDINFTSTTATYKKDIVVLTPNINSLKFINTKNFQSSVVFDKKIRYSRLSSISLNNSKMSMRIDEELNLPIIDLDLEKINSNNIIIPNAANLKNVKLNDSTIIDLTLPSWSNSIKMTGDSKSSSNQSSYNYFNINVKNLTITENSGFETTLVLDNIKDLQTVIAGPNVTKLTIKNCKYLTSVTVSTNITELSIISCSSLAPSFSVGTTVLTNNLINLKACSKLTNISFQNTSNFTKVNIGINKGIKINKDGFNNCKDLEYLDNEDNGDYSGYYLIDGSACFMNSYNFTLRRCPKDSEDSEKYPNILFETNSPTTCFYLSSYSNNNHIDFDAVNEFFNRNYNAKDSSNKRRIERVVSIDNLFYNQAGIGAAWEEAENGFSVNFDHLSGFINVVTAKNAFWRTGIRYWSKELFNFGKFANNGLYIDSCFFNDSSVETHVKIDFLENIGPKLRSLVDLSDDGAGGTGGFYVFHDTNGNEITNVNLQSVFGKCKDGNSSHITQVRIFYQIKDRTTDNKPVMVDLRDCFDGFTEVTLISHFIFNMSNWKNLTYPNSTGTISSCLQACEKLQNINTCFANTSKIIETDPTGYAVTDGNGNEIYTNIAIDLYHFLTQKQWRQTTFNIFSTNNGNRGGNFGCLKEITYDNFNALKGLLTHNSNKITSFGPIFRNTDIINCSDNNNNEFPLLSLISKNTPATSFYYTFSNIRAYTGNQTSTKIPTRLLDDNGYSIFKYYPDCTSIRGIYSSNWFSDSIPLNFFQLRGTPQIVKGYFPNIQQSNLDKLNKDKEYIYYINNDLSAPTLPDILSSESLETQGDIIFSSGWTEDQPTLSNLEEDPKTMRIETSLSNRSIWVSYRDKGASEKTPKLFCNPLPLEKFNNPLVLDVKYTPYKISRLRDLSGAFSNCKWVKPYCYYDPNSQIYNTYINETSYIREKDNPAKTYTYYYTNENCTNLDPLYRESTEVDDLILGKNNNSTNYISTSDGTSIQGTSPQGTSILIKLSNFGLINDDVNNVYPLIPPDFFYGISSTVTMDNLFSSSNNFTMQATQDGGGLIAAPSLEGYLPPHLFLGSNISSIGTLENWIKNCNVLPILYNEVEATGEKPIKNYLFIPQNFLPFSHSKLSNAFNFHIRIPMETTNYIEHYYIMSQESIKKTGAGESLLLNNTFPEYTTHGDRGGGTYIINTHSNNVDDVSKMNYNLNLYLIGLTEIDIHTNKPIITNGGINDLGSTWSLGSFDNLISADLLYLLNGYIVNPNNNNSTLTLNKILSTISNGKSLFKAWTYGVGDAYEVRGINQYCRLPVADSSFNTEATSKKVFSNDMSKGCINSLSLGQQEGEISLWNSSFNLNVVR